MTVFGLTIRALLLRARTLGLALLPLLVGAFAVLAGVVASGNLRQIYGIFSGTLVLSLVVALVCLVLGINAFDDDREGATLVLLMATATPRWRIVVAKWAAAWVSSVVVCVPAFVGCAVLGTRSDLAVGPLIIDLALSMVLGCAGYTALFVLLSLVSQRGLLIGLAYVVVWEGSLSAHTHALRDLSVGAYARRVLAHGVGHGSVPFTFSDAGPVAAAITLVGVTVASTAIASWRLPRLDISH